MNPEYIDSDENEREIEDLEPNVNTSNDFSKEMVQGVSERNENRLRQIEAEISRDKEHLPYQIELQHNLVREKEEVAKKSLEIWIETLKNSDLLKEYFEPVKKTGFFSKWLGDSSEYKASVSDVEDMKYWISRMSEMKTFNLDEFDNIVSKLCRVKVLKPVLEQPDTSIEVLQESIKDYSSAMKKEQNLLERSEKLDRGPALLTYGRESHNFEQRTGSWKTSAIEKEGWIHDTYGVTYVTPEEIVGNPFPPEKIGYGLVSIDDKDLLVLKRLTPRIGAGGDRRTNPNTIALDLGEKMWRFVNRNPALLVKVIFSEQGTKLRELLSSVADLKSSGEKFLEKFEEELKSMDFEKLHKELETSFNEADNQVLQTDNRDKFIESDGLNKLAHYIARLPPEDRMQFTWMVNGTPPMKEYGIVDHVWTKKA